MPWLVNDLIAAALLLWGIGLEIQSLYSEQGWARAVMQVLAFGLVFGALVMMHYG